MKQKKVAKERNQFVALALFRKAGSHRKSNKALRRHEKMKTVKQELDTTQKHSIPTETSDGLKRLNRMLLCGI